MLAVPFIQARHLATLRPSNMADGTAHKKSTIKIDYKHELEEEYEGQIDFTDVWDEADIVFVVEGRKIYANRGVLSMCSPVFKTMFTSDFKERAMTEIPLPGKKFNSVVELMKVIHPPNKHINDTNVYKILQLLQEYQITQVMAKCEEFLMSEPPTVKNLILADRLNMVQLHNSCVNYLRDFRLEDIEGQAKFEPTTLVEILRYKFENLSRQVKDLESRVPRKVPKAHQLSTEEVCKLMLEAPSVVNLVKADQHNIQPLRRDCIKYAKGVKFAQLRHHKSFTKLAPATLIEILTDKVLKLEKNT